MPRLGEEIELNGRRTGEKVRGLQERVVVVRGGGSVDRRSVVVRSKPDLELLEGILLLLSEMTEVASEVGLGRRGRLGMSMRRVS